MKSSISLIVLVLVVAVAGYGLISQSPDASAVQWGYEDGTYRGIFADGNEIQVSIQFTLDDNVITAISFRGLNYRGNDYRSSDDLMIKGLFEQYQELIQYLVGKDIRASLEDLRQPDLIVESTVVDTFTGATLRGNKIMSAMRDALNRGVYSY